MKIQLDVETDLNKRLKIYKIENNLNTLGDSVVNILNSHFYYEETIREDKSHGKSIKN